MRWFRAPSPPCPKEGDTRRVKRFLLWPMELYVPALDKNQVRWLEWVTVEQKFELCGNFEYVHWEWRNTTFIDEEKT